MRPAIKRATKTYPNLEGEEIHPIHTYDANIIDLMIDLLQKLLPGEMRFLNSYKELPDEDFFRVINRWAQSKETLLEFQNTFSIQGQTIKVSNIVTMDKFSRPGKGEFSIVFNNDENLRIPMANKILTFSSEEYRDQVYDRFYFNMKIWEKLQFLVK